MYTLTLTSDERKAIDWVGHRYGHGNALFDLLSDYLGEFDWSDPCDISFCLPEHVAWMINDIAYECDFQWDCFEPTLSRKLTDFCLSIV